MNLKLVAKHKVAGPKRKGKNIQKSAKDTTATRLTDDDFNMMFDRMDHIV